MTKVAIIGDGAAALAEAAAVKVGRQLRNVTLRKPEPKKDDAAAAAAPLVGDDRLLTLSFSSEEPVDRWFGDEVLSHAGDAPDFSRLNDGAPLLWNHDFDRIIGVVEKAWVDGGRGFASVRFADSPDGNQFLSLVNQGVVRNVSFAYQVNAFTTDGEGSPSDRDEDPVYTATSWLAYEISLVSVPADQTVGVGRADASEAREVPIARRSSSTTKQTAANADTLKGKQTMDPEKNGAAPNAAEVEARIRMEAAQAERSRAAEIRAIGKRIGADDLAEQLVSGGKTLDEARAAFLEKLGAKQIPVGGQGQGDVDMTDKEKRNYSVIRAVRASIEGNWTKAGFEREVSNAIGQKSGRELQSGSSFFAPMNIPFHAEGALPPVRGYPGQRATYQVGTAAQGGNLVATNLLAQSFIEVLRNSTVTGKLGAQYLSGLIGKVAIPRRSAASTAFWVGESTAITEAESTFDQVTLQPRSIGSLGKMSRLMLLQATPDIEMLARNDLVAILGLGIDLAAISGSGASGQPSGIVNQAGVASVIGGTNGANLTFDHIIQLYSGPRIANAPQQNLGFAFNAKAYGYLSTQKSTTGQYLWMPNGGIGEGPSDNLRGYPYAVSNQLRATLTKGTSAGICSELVFGNWQELLIGEWGVLEIMVNPYDSTGFANGDVVVRAFQTIDVGVRHGASFSVMSDALTPGF